MDIRDSNGKRKNSKINTDTYVQEEEEEKVLQ